MPSPVFPLTVFYDGACSVCAREIHHYKSKDRHDRLILVDISKEDFEPAAYGKTMEEFMAQMHVRDGQGVYFLGVDAFPALWRALPGRLFPFFAGVVTLPGIHFLARLGYRLFARYRTIVFPVQHSCSAGRCGRRH